MLQVLSWTIFFLALTRAVWLAFAPQRCSEDRRRRWLSGAAHAGVLTHARQQPR